MMDSETLADTILEQQQSSDVVESTDVVENAEVLQETTSETVESNLVLEENEQSTPCELPAEQQMDIDENVTLSEKVVGEDVALINENVTLSDGERVLKEDVILVDENVTLSDRVPVVEEDVVLVDENVTLSDRVPVVEEDVVLVDENVTLSDKVQVVQEDVVLVNEKLIQEDISLIDENLTLSEKVVEEDVSLTVPDETSVVQDAPPEKIDTEIANEYVEQEQPQVKITDTIMHQLEQLPDSYTVTQEIGDSLPTMQTNDATVHEPTDILQEAAKKIEPNKWKPKSGAFSLGVPGLSFSAQNLKISSDGTKMVQIHQSQITPGQLEALQANPNIKVVFRHIPSGKSFTKPPKNLFSKKDPTKIISPENGDKADDSVYNFDDFDESPSKETKTNAKLSNGITTNRYARYNPNVGFKKKPGRPRLQDANLNPDGSKPVLPAQIQLTDALVKLNKPGALYTIKVHVKQVTHDILINMELNPKYNIVLTAKHENPPEHSLEQLVKEWEEKESMDQPQEPTKDEVQKKEPTEKVKEAEIVELDAVESELDTSQETPSSPAPEQDKAKKDSNQDAKLKETPKVRQQVKEEEEEAVLLSASMKETTSRSGRIRKPSRFSLDIARITKRRAADSGDDTPASKKSRLVQSPPSASKIAEADASKGTEPKRGRGRPQKKSKKGVDPVPAATDEDKPEDEEGAESGSKTSPTKTGGPRVLLSPSDKRRADKKLFGNKTDGQQEEMEVTDPVQEQDLPKKSGQSPKKTNQSPKKTDKSSQNETSTTPEQTSIVESEESDLPDLNKKSKSSGKLSPLKVMESPSTLSANDNESPSDVLARKLSKEGGVASKKTDGAAKKMETETTALKDFVEEEGDVDNKYRLRKLLQQCSIEEIRSVAMPKALETISVGDFFIHKADQMSSKKVSFTSLYRQLEDFYSYMEKESMRYSTLLRRANKVGGDRRMEKVILMPVYNKLAAESLNISSSSVDAHIGGIYQKPTTPMIAANSFHMNCKMDPPVHRLKLPDISDKNYSRKKQSYPFATTLSSQQAHLDALTAQQQNYAGGRTRGSWKKPHTIRKSQYVLGEDVPGQVTTMTLQEHARIQAASRYQTTLKQASTTLVDATSSTILQTGAKSDAGEAKAIISQPAGTETIQLSSLTPEVGGQVAGETVTEEGAAIVQAEDGKQLVSIGDGQYVELPEGYTLIQTDEGYIIGQPGATFVQGEDGNVYMTSTEEGTSEITEQVLTKTVDVETPAEEQVLQELTQP